MQKTETGFPGFIIAFAALSGCAHLEHDIGSPLAVESLSNISEGSHYAGVLDQFGPPPKISALPDGMAFLYERVKLAERQYGLIPPGEIGKWIKAVYASADVDVEVMLLVFDEQGKLRSTDAQTWSADAGAGKSMILIFSAGSFANTEQEAASYRFCSEFADCAAFNASKTSANSGSTFSIDDHSRAI